MTKKINDPLQPLILSQGCQFLSDQQHDWIFSFINEHQMPPDQIPDRDMWLFKRHNQLEGTVSIWSVPPDRNQTREWVVVGGENLKGSLDEDFEVLIFVKDSICYTLLEYLELEFGEEKPFQIPDFVHPGN